MNPDLIILKRFNLGDGLMRAMRQHLRDLLEVRLRQVRMGGGQTTLIHGFAAHAR
jgi:hypothetical protein